MGQGCTSTRASGLSQSICSFGGVAGRRLKAFHVALGKKSQQKPCRASLSQRQSASKDDSEGSRKKKRRFGKTMRRSDLQL